MINISTFRESNILNFSIQVKYKPEEVWGITETSSGITETPSELAPTPSETAETSSETAKTSSVIFNTI